MAVAAIALARCRAVFAGILIQALLGHASLETTQRYTRVEISDLQDVSTGLIRVGR